jgi:hypothetical protein
MSAPAAVTNPVEPKGWDKLHLLVELRAASRRFEMARNGTRWAIDLLSTGRISAQGAANVFAEVLRDLEGGSA